MISQVKVTEGFCCVQNEAQAGLSFSKAVLEVAAALRAGLYARTQALQLLKAPIPCEALNLSLLSGGDSAVAAPVGAVDQGDSSQPCC